MSFLLFNFIYQILGGRQGKLPVTAFEMYDFETEKWITLHDIPSKRMFSLYAASNTHIYSVGGIKEDAREGFSDTCEVFSIETGLFKPSTKCMF